jgi:preprotein translocase subunit SecE
MASVTKNGEKTMATDVTASGPGDMPEGNQPQKFVRPPQGGMFTIVKKGQGYWTRMGTAGVAVLLIALVAINTHMILKDQFRVLPNVSIGIAIGVAIALMIISWRLMNKPTHVDFLIATDSEMKKVNWTSRADLIGATKVVILFMFFIAAFLLLIDVVFGYFFQLITVLKTGPFG